MSQSCAYCSGFNDYRHGKINGLDPLAAAELQHSLPAELRDPVQGRQMRTFGVEDTRHGLYAFTVVPRAPNFSALRRVSSNAERA